MIDNGSNNTLIFVKVFAALTQIKIYNFMYLKHPPDSPSLP